MPGSGIRKLALVVGALAGVGCFAEADSVGSTGSTGASALSESSDGSSVADEDSSTGEVESDSSAGGSGVTASSTSSSSSGDSGTSDTGDSSGSSSSGLGEDPDELCNGLDDDRDGEIDEDEVCPDACYGFQLDDDRGVAICIESVQWLTAETLCSSLDGSLVKIDDEEYVSPIAIEINTQLGIGNMWMGANDIELEGSWRWPDGTVFWEGGPGGMPADDAFVPWAANEPSVGERCGFAAWSSEWGNVHCNVSLPGYICDVPAIE